MFRLQAILALRMAIIMLWSTSGYAGSNANRQAQAGHDHYNLPSASLVHQHGSHFASPVYGLPPVQQASRYQTALPASGLATAQMAKPPQPPIPEYPLDTAIESISHADLKAYVLEMAKKNQDIQDPLKAWLRTRHHEMILREQKKTINFDHYSKSVWKELNIRHARKSGSHQYEAAGDAYNCALEAISDIEGKVKPHSSFQTKKSAMETLRKIGKTICLADDR